MSWIKVIVELDNKLGDCCIFFLVGRLVVSVGMMVVKMERWSL